MATPFNLSKSTTGKTPQQWWSEMGYGGSPQPGGKKAPMNAGQISAMDKAYNQQAQYEQYQVGRDATAKARQKDVAFEQFSHMTDQERYTYAQNQQRLADKSAADEKYKGTGADWWKTYATDSRNKAPEVAMTPQQAQARASEEAQRAQQAQPTQTAGSTPRNDGYGGPQSQPTFVPSQPFGGGTNANPWGGGQQQSYTPQQNPYGAYGQQPSPYGAYGQQGGYGGYGQQQGQYGGGQQQNPYGGYGQQNYSGGRQRQNYGGGQQRQNPYGGGYGGPQQGPGGGGYGGGQQPTFFPQQQATPQAGGKRGVPTNRDTPYEAYEKDEAGDAIQYGPDGRRKMKSQVMPVLAPGMMGIQVMPKEYNKNLDAYGDPLARPGQYKHPAFPDEWESDEAYDARMKRQNPRAMTPDVPPGTARTAVVQDQYGKPIPQFPFSGNQNVPQSTFTAQYGNMNGGYSSQPNYGQRDAFIQNINDTTAGYQGNQGTYLGQGAPPQSWGQAPQYNVPQMWQQAGNMVSNGWQNPLSGLFQQ